MEQVTHKQMSESFRLGAVLTLTGGFLDAYTHLIQDRVFANAQTGNIVLLGVRLMEGGWDDAGHRLVPTLAFAAGVLAAELIHGRFRRARTLHWRQITMAAELLLLVAVAFLPAALNNAANVLMAFVYAVQMESSRKVDGDAFATTMCTGNLRSGTKRLYLRGETGGQNHGHRAARHYDIIVFFIVGVALGAWCSGRWGQGAVLGTCVLLLVAFLLMFQRKSLARTGKRT